MIYQLKQYTPCTGKAAALRERFIVGTLPIFARVGIRVAAVLAPAEAPDDLWYITAFRDEAARDAAWAAFYADPEWKRVKAASEVDGPVLAHKESTELNALPDTPAL